MKMISKLLVGLVMMTGCGGAPRPVEFPIPSEVDGHAVVAVIDPCGDALEIADEKVLQLDNGDTVRMFYGAKTYISTPGYHYFADEQCLIEIDATFTVVNECNPSSYTAGQVCPN